MNVAPRYTVIVLCGHQGSGKSTLAAHYAARQTPPAKVISVRALAREFLARLWNVSEAHFEFPLSASVAVHEADGGRTTYGMLFDDFYDGTRTALPWTVWVEHAERLINAELQRADGAALCFIVDDIVHRDECEYLLQLPRANSIALYLDGNPGQKLPLDTHRSSYHTRNDIRDACTDTEDHFILTTEPTSSPDDLAAALARYARLIDRMLRH